MYQNTLVIQRNGRKAVVDIDEILYIESCKPQLLIKTLTDSYVIYGSLIHMEQTLKPQGFFRCHRAYLVNLRQIKEVIAVNYTFDLILYSDDRVPLSRKQEKALRQYMLRKGTYCF